MRWNRNLLAGLLLLLNTCLLSAQDVPPGLQAALDKALDSMGLVLNIKSISVALALPSNVVWANATGVSAANEAVTPNHTYLIGSTTKMLTAACILQLDDEGVLSIDDPLHQWLDTIPNIKPDIRIRQLMQHTSGIFDVLYNPACSNAFDSNPGYVWDAEELVRTFILPPSFAPGTGWGYSNTNYFLLSMIIKKATGKPFFQVLRERFFEPMGLNSIAIPAFEPLTAPVAHAWLDLTGDGILDDAHDFYMNFKALNSAAGAAGGYFATPTEVVRWLSPYFRNDLVSPALMAQAKTTVTGPGSGVTYGLGLMKRKFLGLDAYGHGGDLVYHSTAWYFPSKDISISVLTNDGSQSVTSWSIAPVVTALLKAYCNWEATSEVAAPTPLPIEIKTAPNPFVDRLTVRVTIPSFEPALEFCLSDIQGNLVKKVSAEAFAEQPVTVIIPGLDALASGVYVLTLRSGDRVLGTARVFKT